MSLVQWTECEAEIARLGALADAIEIAACIENGGYMERVDSADGADVVSVYLHFPAPGPGASPDALCGVLCVSDRFTVADAKAHADELAARFSLPIHDFT